MNVIKCGKCNKDKLRTEYFSTKLDICKVCIMNKALPAVAHGKQIVPGESIPPVTVIQDEKGYPSQDEKEENPLTRLIRTEKQLIAVTVWAHELTALLKQLAAHPVLSSMIKIEVPPAPNSTM